MHTIQCRNVNVALPLALHHLRQNGVRRESRNGPVLLAPTPVTTIYERPRERVLLDPVRDANPFFHLFESVWMLCGDNRIAPLLHFNKQMLEYSDDGTTQNGAYGWRWRCHFDQDQLLTIAGRLRKNPDDRRCVLQMWDADFDLGKDLKDVPCNLIATFQRDSSGALDMVVFCRSNDIVWGCYGANAVHFSVVHEYVAKLIGCPLGIYTQISVNWHGYLKTLGPLESLGPDPARFVPDPYDSYQVGSPNLVATPLDIKIETIDYVLRDIARMAVERSQYSLMNPKVPKDSRFAMVCHLMFEAHKAYRRLQGHGEERYLTPILILDTDSSLQNADWIVAGKQWLHRRLLRYQEVRGGDQE